MNLPVLDAVPDAPTQDLLRRIDALPAPHVLALGRIHPVKNLELAVAALVRLRRLPGCEQATLLLAGPSAPATLMATRCGRRRRRLGSVMPCSSWGW